jgi:hypothetical protein
MRIASVHGGAAWDRNPAAATARQCDRHARLADEILVSRIRSVARVTTVAEVAKNGRYLMTGAGQFLKKLT